MIPLIGAHDFPYVFSDQVTSWLTVPMTWASQSHDSLGVFTLSTLWTWPYGLLYGVFGKIGLNFTLATLILGILPVFIVSWVAMGKLLKSYGLSFPARLVGQLLFSVNTYVLMLVDGGQISLALAYSLLPLVIYYLNSRRGVLVVVAIISFLDMRYVYLLFMLIGIQVIFDFRNVFKYLVTGLIIGLVLVGLHSYWLLPAALSKGPSLPSTYTRLAQVDNLSFASLSHALFLQHPHWPQNIFGQVGIPSPYLVVLPILAFLPLIAFKKSITVAYWSVMAIISVFLAKGSGTPFGEVYSWLFSHIPGFSLFRDPTKFFPLVGLAYGVLIAFTTHVTNFRRKYLAIVAYLLFLIAPVLTQATGLFSIARNQQAYQQVANYLQEDETEGSLLWVPSKPPLGYSSPTHPSIDALTLLDKRPFTTGVVGSYDLMNFLRDATYSGQLLDIAGIKYIGLPSVDPKRDSLKPEDIKYRTIFTNQLSSLPWIESAFQFGQVTLLQTTNHQSLFFVPPETTFVIGADDIYNSVNNLSQDGLVFVESQPGLLSRILQFPEAKILLNRKSNIDVAAALIDQKNIFFPDIQLDFDPNYSGWWKRETADLISWRDFLQQKYNLDNQDFSYGGGWSVSEGSHTLVVSPQINCQTDCILLTRVMVSPNGGEVSFSTENNLIGKVITYSSNVATTTRHLMGYQEIPDQIFTYSRADFLWQEVGHVVGNLPITISTQGDINVVNSLATVPAKEWEGYKSQADKVLTAVNTNQAAVSPKVSYQKIGPAHYRVTVTNLDRPAMLVFGQNYDSFWRLSGQSPVPVYSLLNGFSISKGGQYDLVFLPQKYMLPGLAISLVTGLGVALLMLRKNR